VYDSLNRLTYTVQPNGEISQNHYDKAGQLVQETTYSNLLSLDELKQPITQAYIEYHLIKDSAHDRTERFIFDSANRLQYHIDAQGYVTETRYDLLAHTQTTIQYANAIDPYASDISASLKPDTYSDRHNTQVFDKAGREIYHINSDGYVLEREYDANGNIIKEIAHAQKVALENLSLNSVQQALAAQSALDRITLYNYDDAGRLHETIDALLQSEVYEYDAAGNVTSKTDKKKLVWTYEYDAMNRLTREISPETSITEYANGRWQTVNRQVITRTDYDSFGNKILVVGDEGHVNQVIQYQYDKLNRVVKSLVDAPVDASTPDVGSNNAARQERMTTLSTETVYDAFGNVAAEKDRAGNWSYHVYNLQGRKEYSIDGNGAVVNFRYDNLGNLSQQIHYANRINLSSQTRIYYPKEIAISPSVYDKETTFSYNAAGQLIEKQDKAVRYFDPKTNTYKLRNPTTEYHYDAFGEVILTRTKFSEGDWVESRVYFDKQGRKRAEVNGENYVSEFEYNQFGEMSAQIEYANRTDVAHDSDYYPVRASSSDRRVEFSYDAIGQLSTKTLKNVTYQRLSGNSYETITGDLTTTYTYDSLGHQTSMRDAQGNTSYWYYDNLGNVRAKMGPAVDGVHQATLTYHNSLGEVSIEEQWANGATNASVNGFNLVGASNKDRISHIYYDSLGNAITRIEANGQEHFETYYSYNANGNITRCWREVADASGSLHVNDTRYLYDANGNQINTLTFERDGSMIEEKAVYNAFGEMIEKNTNNQFTIHYDYDSQGRVWRTNKDGNYQIFVYDLSGNLTQVIQSTNAYQSETNEKGVDLAIDYFETTISFDKQALRYSLQRTSNTYDKAGNLINQVREKSESANQEQGGTVDRAGQSYTVDRWGNVLSHTDARDNTTHYTYNAFNQVICQELPSVAVMDEHGNITEQSPTLR